MAVTDCPACGTAGPHITIFVPGQAAEVVCCAACGPPDWLQQLLLAQAQGEGARPLDFKRTLYDQHGRAWFCHKGSGNTAELWMHDGPERRVYVTSTQRVSQCGRYTFRN